MSDASGATSLSVGDLLKLIAGARAGTADPISTGSQSFKVSAKMLSYQVTF